MVLPKYISVIKHGRSVAGELRVVGCGRHDPPPPPIFEICTPFLRIKNKNNEKLGKTK